MNTKLKIVGYIVITLVIGIIIGAMLNRAIVQNRIKDIFQRRAAGLLIFEQEELLQSASPEQQKLIRDILQKHGQQLADIHARFRQEIESSFKSLKKEIDPLLTPKQKNHFERMMPSPPPFPRRPPDEFMFRKRPSSPEAELAFLQDALDLSEEQTAQVKIILQKYQDQEKSLWDRGMSPEKMSALREVSEKKEKEIESLLTESQKEKYQQLKKRFGRKNEDRMKPGERQRKGPPGFFPD